MLSQFLWTGWRKTQHYAACVKLYFRYNGRFHNTPISVQKIVCPLWHDCFTHFVIELTAKHLWVQIICKLRRPFVCPIHNGEISFRPTTITHRLCYLLVPRNLFRVPSGGNPNQTFSKSVWLVKQIKGLQS